MPHENDIVQFSRIIPFVLRHSEWTTFSIQTVISESFNQDQNMSDKGYSSLLSYTIHRDFHNLDLYNSIEKKNCYLFAVALITRISLCLYQLGRTDLILISVLVNESNSSLSQNSPGLKTHSSHYQMHRCCTRRRR